MKLNFATVLLLLFSLLINAVSLNAAAETQYECGVPSFDSSYNLDIPCAGLGERDYHIRLTFNGNSQNMGWSLDSLEEGVDCQWSSANCATFGDNFELIIPQIPIDGKPYTLELMPQLGYEVADPINLGYITAYPTNSGWYRSDSHGALSSCPIFEKYNGEGKTLLAVYMVGSDLESGFSSAATVDLVEMLDGYAALGDEAGKIDIIVAFGGSAKENWQGVRFATIAQLIEDAKDGSFGNLNGYDYKEERAHMGDISTLKLFLNYLKERASGHSASSIIFWDHGADYNGFGFDENYRMSSLSLEEIQQAFLSVQTHFDLIGFDACLMASMETANFVYEFGNYLLASEELEPGHGWQWEKVVIEHANRENVLKIAENIIKDYVDENSYSVNRSGKTLSVVDLGKFPFVKQATSYFVDELIAKLHEKDIETAGKIAVAVEHARVYPKSGKSVSVDLQDLAINIIGSFSDDLSIVKKADDLISALNGYILYSRHDGSRPYSYGTTINLPTNAPHDVCLDSSIKALQTMWKNISLNDSKEPVVQNESNNVSLFDVSLFDAGFSQEDIDALKALIDSNIFSSEELEFLKRCYDIIVSEEFSFDEKIAALDELENSGRGVFPRGTLKNIIFSRGVFPRSVILNEDNSLFSAKGSLFKSGNKKQIPAFMLGERSAFLYNSSPVTKNGKIPNSIAQKSRDLDSSGISGTVASFTDKYLKKVSTIYGTLHTNQQTDSVSFEMTAEIPAYPTERAGEYFTPVWNRMWYTLQYDPQLPNEWLPLKYESQYHKDGTTYAVYSCEIEYIAGDESYPSVSGECSTEDICEASGYVSTSCGCAHRATLELTMDSENNVVNHKVTTYNKWTSSEDFFLLDKNAKELKPGDAVRFIFDATGDIEYEDTTTKGFLYFTQAPQFSVELLTFVDPFVNGEKKFYKFYYAMRAVDIAGNSIITTPMVAYVQMPDCVKLNEMRTSIANAVAELSSGSVGIVFNSPLGDALDEAMSTAVTLLESEQGNKDTNFKNVLIALFDILYNEKTYNTETIWDWRSVNWQSVRSQLTDLLKSLEVISKDGCPEQ